MIEQEHVRELDDFAQTACGEMSMQAMDDPSYYGKKIESLIKKMKRNGGDVQGALADHFYSDPSTMADLLGDRLYDLLSGKGWKYEDAATWNTALRVLCDEYKHTTMERKLYDALKR